MRVKRNLIACCALIAAAAPGAAAEPKTPTGQWLVDFDDAQCVASRDYGTKEDPLILALKAPPLGNVMQLVVARPGGGRSVRHLETTIEMDGAEKINTSMVAYSALGTKRRLFRINLPLTKFEAVSKAKTIRIRSGELDESFALTQMQPLLRIIAECTDDLRKVWNVGEFDVATTHPHPNTNRTLRERSIGDLQGLISAADYPDVAIRKEGVGSVRMALLIDENGRIADCTVIETSGFAALDAQSCALVQKRARFKPAVGLDGKPAKDAVVQRITWQLR